MRQQHIYVDASVVGGSEDEEFAEDTRRLWDCFINGTYVQMLSEHTLSLNYASRLSGMHNSDCLKNYYNSI